jgi:hypothetical protein
VSVVMAGATYYGFSDKSSFIRADLKPSETEKTILTADEHRILYLASLAPSGTLHNPGSLNILNRSTGKFATIKVNGYPLLIRLSAKRYCQLVHSFRIWSMQPTAWDIDVNSV